MTDRTEMEKYKNVIVGAAEFIKGKMHVKVTHIYIYALVKKLFVYRSFVFCDATNEGFAEINAEHALFLD